MPLRILSRGLLGFLALLVCSVCYASESAVIIIYQPIITESEAHPKGFTILPIPFWWFQTAASDPYFAITKPNQLLTDAPPSEVRDDRNLLSSAGVIIGSTEENGPVYVRFENIKRPDLASKRSRTTTSRKQLWSVCAALRTIERSVPKSSSVARTRTRRSGRNGKSILSSIIGLNRSPGQRPDEGK